jgi:hypothetical protein
MPDSAMGRFLFCREVLGKPESPNSVPKSRESIGGVSIRLRTPCLLTCHQPKAWTRTVTVSGAVLGIVWLSSFLRSMNEKLE